MKIGNLEIKNNVFLAPMAGVSDLPFRCLCREYGCGMVYSEMISAKGLHYNDKKTADLMQTIDEENPYAIQIFGSDAKIMSGVVKKVIDAGAQVIDINMGCPTPKIVNNQDGSALLKNPKLAGEIVCRVKEASSVPVTVKIRKGWDENSINAVLVSKILEENGADAICVHGRTREQFYSGKADWDIIKEVKKAVKIPVIGNGDIFSAQDAVDMMNYTGCDGVMVARGAQGNPFIFKQINELINDGKVSFYPEDFQKINDAIRLLEHMVLLKGERRGVKEARKHIAWFIKGIKGNAQVKNKVFTMDSSKDVIEILKKLSAYVAG